MNLRHPRSWCAFPKHHLTCLISGAKHSESFLPQNGKAQFNTSNNNNKIITTMADFIRITEKIKTIGIHMLIQYILIML